jgi:hypothetical protein
VFNLNGSLSLSSSTLARNSASDGGGAVFNLGSGGEATQSGPALTVQQAIVTLHNSILSNSTNGTDPVSDYLAQSKGGGTQSSSGSFNIVQSNPGTGGFSGTSSQVDPLLVGTAPADKGGPTATFALQSGSPAIDQGDDSSTAPTTDQRGETRPSDNPAITNATGGDGSDIGAYEFQNSVPVVATNSGLTVALGATATITEAMLKVTDADGDTLTYTITSAPAKGTLNFNGSALGSGTFTQADIAASKLSYTHTGGDFSSDSFTFSVSDGNGGTMVATFNILVAETQSLIVTTIADDSTNTDGKISLREAIAYSTTLPATPAPEITFAIPANQQVGGVWTITLNGTELVLNRSLTLTGPGANLLTVSGNNASRVFSVTGASVAISGLTVSNGITSSTTLYGGGIYNNAGTLSLTNVTVSNNTSAYAGGGIMNLSGTLSVRNSTISGNTARNTNSALGSGNSFGGGIAVAGPGAGLTLTNSTISGNTATTTVSGVNGLGGGIYSEQVTDVINSAISGNTASGTISTRGAGGGVNNSGSGTVIIINSTLSGNRSGDNGGGLTNSGTASLVHSTVTDNTSTFGGGVRNFGTCRLRNTIVASNTATTDSDVRNGTSPAFTSLGHNLIGTMGGATGFTNGSNGDIAGTNASPVNARLGALANYGGLTKTHELQSDSPAINAGNNALIPAGITTDQRGNGFARLKGGRTDIGSFEFQNDAPTLSDTSFTFLKGVSISEQLAGSDSDGNTLSYSVTAGTLPEGLTLSTNGTLSGTPRALTTSAGVDVTVTVADGKGGTGTATINIKVKESPSLEVTHTADSGDEYDGETSLREALAYAHRKDGADEITFNIPQAQKQDGIWKISLSSVLPDLSSDLTITGPGANLLTVSREFAAKGRIFKVTTGQTITLAGLTLTNGDVTDGGADGTVGGAIWNQEGNLTLNSCTLSGNSAAHGGAIFNSTNTDNATLTLNQCSLINNQSTYHGGAIYNSGSDDNGGGVTAALVLSNCSLAGNKSGNRGAAVNSYGTTNATVTTTIAHCTLVDNVSSGNEGTIYNWNNGATSVTTSLSHTLLKTVSGKSSFDQDGGTIVSNGYNLTNEDASGVLNQSGDRNDVTDFHLGTLQNNGGPTQTIALLSGSPAINAGEQNYNGPLTTDQRGSGFLRVKGARLDIGAFEVQNLTPEITRLSALVGRAGRVVTLHGKYFTGVTDVKFNTISVPTSDIEFLADDRVRVKVPAGATSGPVHLTTPAGTGSSSASFVVDNSAPAIAITSPTADASLRSLSSISGTVAEEAAGGVGSTGGSGLRQVYVRLRRSSDNKWWTSTGWSNTGDSSSTFAATVDSAAATWSSDVSAAALPAGTYLLYAYASDQAGNTSFVSRRVAIAAPDTTAPVISISSPADNSNVSSLASISGLAADEAGGSGMRRVYLRIRRTSDLLWYSPGGWSATTTAGTSLAATYNSGTGAWSCTAGPNSLATGTYLVYAYAIDGVGNTSYVRHRVNVSRAGSTLAGTSSSTSSVKLSSAVLQSSGVQLKFTGALDTASAIDAATYQVQVNGKAAEVESVRYESSSRAVTLSLSESLLQAGDDVVVSWS